MENLTSVQHSLVKHIVKLQNDRAYRYEQKSLVIEGKKMVQEVCETVTPRHVLATDASLIPPNTPHEKRYLISPQVLKKVSKVESPEGVLAEIEMPKPSNLQGRPRILVLDRIQDPGNLGTLIRTALCLGWDSLFLLEPCCDPYNDKALRAAKGATLRVKIQMGDITTLKQFGQAYQWLAADLEGLAPEKVVNAEKRILILGQEGMGLSKEVKTFSQRVTLPISKEMESLNVAIAGGILMYLLK